MNALQAQIEQLGPAGAIDYIQANLPQVSHGDVLAAIKAQFSLSQTFVHRQCDPFCHLAPKSRLMELAQCGDFPPVPFTNQYMDCTKFARRLWGWLAQVGLGTLAIGLIQLVPFKVSATGVKRYFLSSHMVLFAVDDTKTCWLIEPQDKTLYPANTYTLGGFPEATGMEVDFVMF